MGNPASPTPPTGLFASLKGTLATLLDIFQTRLALLRHELAEEKRRLSRLVVLAAAAVFFLVVGILLLLGFLIVLFWEDRLLLLGVLTGGFLLLGTACLLGIRRLVRQGRVLFSASLQALREDVAALRGRDGQAATTAPTTVSPPATRAPNNAGRP